MRRYCLFIIILSFISCNSNPKHPKSTKEIPFSKLEYQWHQYPPIIDSMNLESLYDSTKWWLYCIYCDDIIKFWKQTHIKNSNVTMGTLKLKFIDFSKMNDTVVFRFNFYYQDSILCDERLARISPFKGIMYKLSDSNRIPFYLSSNGSSIITGGTIQTSRAVKPLQPEVIQYIKHNKEKLDPWFRKEAIKRGIINNHD